MDKRKIRILGVAPYEGLKTIMERVAEGIPEVQLEAFLGDLDEGVSIVSQRLDEPYDVIISRGGTASRIAKLTDIPVVSIQVSVYDILRAIKMAESYDKLFAIVGFPSITQPAHTLCDLLSKDVDILTVQNESEVSETLDRLKQGGYRMIIGGMHTHILARSKGLDAFLITAGLESVYDAFQQAVSISRRFQKLRLENIFLQRIADSRSGNTVVLSEKGEVFYYTKEKPREDELQDMRSHISAIPPTSPLKYYRNESGLVVRVTAHTLRIGSEKYYSFRCVDSQIPLRSSTNGIRIFAEVEILQLFMNSFYSVSGVMGSLEQQVNAMAVSRQPVIILGETGTGKEQIARALYLRGPQSKSPFIVVDCRLMTERNWNFLFSHPSSPLNDESGTIYFQNFESFPPEFQSRLLAAVTDTDISRRLRLIFSATCMEGEDAGENVQNVVSMIGCLTLSLPTLRSRADEIPSLAVLYLSNLNMETGKEVIGFDAGATDILIHYEWPNNFTQFKHVLMELLTLADGPYIRRSAVIEILSRERHSRRRSPAKRSETGYETRTLDEITRQAIEDTLQAVGGNQTAAAKQLGISRTTLWRYMTPKN